VTISLKSVLKARNDERNEPNSRKKAKAKAKAKAQKKNFGSKIFIDRQHFWS
jgi:hypothetical protein